MKNVLSKKPASSSLNAGHRVSVIYNNWRARVDENSNPNLKKKQNLFSPKPREIKVENQYILNSWLENTETTSNKTTSGLKSVDVLHSISKAWTSIGPVLTR